MGREGERERHRTPSDWIRKNGGEREREREGMRRRRLGHLAGEHDEARELWRGKEMRWNEGEIG